MQPKKIKIAILISGRGSNMQALINACKNEDFPAQISLIISNNENAQGLGFARKNGIETLIVDHRKFSSRRDFDAQLDVEISKRNCELICLAGFMRLLSAEFVEKWQGKIINIHPSLLPDFKGANAVGDAIKAGVKKTGCTVHFVIAKMDEGPIIIQKEVAILPDDTKETLAARILQEEHKIYPLAIEKILNIANKIVATD